VKWSPLFVLWVVWGAGLCGVYGSVVVGLTSPFLHTSLVPSYIYIVSPKIIYQPSTGIRVFVTSRYPADISISKIHLHFAKVSISIWKMWYQLVYVFNPGMNQYKESHLSQFVHNQSTNKRKKKVVDINANLVTSKAWYHRFRKRV